MQWTANEPRATLAAFAHKIAPVMPSALISERQQLLGLNPISLPFSETCSALRTGAIAAQENPTPTSFAMRFHEVQGHATLAQFVSVDKPWREGPTQDCRAAITEAVAVGNEVCLEETLRQEAAAREAMEATGMEFVEVSAEERAAIAQVVHPGIRDWWLAQTGDGDQALRDTLSPRWTRWAWSASSPDRRPPRSSRPAGASAQPRGPRRPRHLPHGGPLT